MAGVCDNRIVMWEDIGNTWNGEVAADMYETAVKEALEKCRPGKKPPKSGKKGKKGWLVLEDNDPAGYKSNLAKAAKKKVGIKSMSLPPYSPDLNPLDYSIWENISSRMMKKKIVGYEPRVAYAKRLRLTALRTPKKFIAKAMGDMKARIKMVIEKKGNAVPKD